MIEDSPFRNYRYVMEYDTEQKIDEKLIKDLLKETIFTTPSKQNMMPYRVHVIGPEEKKIKHLISIKCMLQEDDYNEPHVAGPGKKYQHNNIENAPYVFIFTQRVSTANPYHQDLMQRGRNYEQTNNIKADETLTHIEIGMFANNFGMLCLKNDIDISYTRCFPTNIKFWQEEEFKFLEFPVKLIMTVGKAKRYRRDQGTHIWPDYDEDCKPSFDEVISFE